MSFGLPREVDPHEALLEEVHRMAGHVAWLGELVAALERKQIVHGITKTVQRAQAEGPIVTNSLRKTIGGRLLGGRPPPGARDLAR